MRGMGEKSRNIPKTKRKNCPLGLKNLKRVDMPLNKETKLNQTLLHKYTSTESSPERGDFPSPRSGELSVDVYLWRRVWFSLVSLFNGISTLFRFFNAKSILLEEQWWYYLTHSWEDKGVHTFSKGICPKVNVIAYYDSAVQRFNHYTTRTPPWRRVSSLCKEHDNNQQWLICHKDQTKNKWSLIKCDAFEKSKLTMS